MNEERDRIALALLASQVSDMGLANFQRTDERLVTTRREIVEAAYDWANVVLEVRDTYKGAR